jgi:hypothetical protein
MSNRFICGLINNAFNVSDYTASHDKMGKDMEGRGLASFTVLPRTFLGVLRTATTKLSQDSRPRSPDLNPDSLNTKQAWQPLEIPVEILKINITGR